MKGLFSAEKRSLFLRKMSRTVFDAAMPLAGVIIFGFGPYLLMGAAVLIIIFGVIKVLRKIDKEKRDK